MGRIDQWLWKAGVDPKWFHMAARKNRSGVIQGEPRRVRSSSPAVWEDGPAATPADRGPIIGVDEDARAGGDRPEQGGSSGIAPDANRMHMHPALSTAPRRLLEHSIPHETVRPVPSSSRRLRVVVGGAHVRSSSG
jgi:hypothetical protein